MILILDKSSQFTNQKQERMREKVKSARERERGLSEIF